MRIINLRHKVVIGLLAAVLSAGAAQAILTVSLPEDVAINRVEYYWSGDANGANNLGRIVNPTAGVVLDVTNPNTQARRDNATTYVFGASDASGYAGSGGIYIRIWDGERDRDGGAYSSLAGFTNPFTSPSTVPFGALSYPYIKAAPGNGQITQVDETSSLVLPATRTGKLKVFSRQTPRGDGKIVEAAGCQWEVTRNGSAVDVGTMTGAAIELQTPTFTLSVGDAYRFRVRYRNLWGAWGEFSDWYDHTISGSTTGGSPDTVTLNLKKKSGGLGLNQFAFDTAAVRRGSTPVASLAALVEQINSVGTARVTLLGWWDDVEQIDRGYVVTYSGSTPSFLPVNGAAADPATVAIEARKVYQVGVSENVTVEFTLTR